MRSRLFPPDESLKRPKDERRDSTDGSGKPQKTPRPKPTERFNPFDCYLARPSKAVLVSLLGSAASSLLPGLTDRWRNVPVGRACRPFCMLVAGFGSFFLVSCPGRTSESDYHSRTSRVVFPEKQPRPRFFRDRSPLDLHVDLHDGTSVYIYKIKLSFIVVSY